MVDGGVLLVFTREPVPGKTKTRLIPELGAQAAAQLHNKLLYNTLQEANVSKFSAIQIWSYPDIVHPTIVSYSAKFSASLHRQFGDDLGDRMFNAMNSALNNYVFAVIVGSDCPVINTGIFNQAFDALANGKDAVLGPSEDGGYYLIGLTKAEAGIFREIKWGSNIVLESTRQRLITSGFSWSETEKLWDVDNIKDIDRIKKQASYFLEGIM